MSIEFSPAFDSVRGMGASPMQFAAPAASRKVQKRLKPRTHGRVDHATKAAISACACGRRSIRQGGVSSATRNATSAAATGCAARVRTPPVDEDEIRAAQREREARCDAYVEQCAREVNEATAREDDDRANRTQSKPMKNRDGASETAKCAENGDVRGTKRTHRDDDDDDRSPRAVPNAPRKRGG